MWPVKLIQLWHENQDICLSPSFLFSCFSIWTPSVLYIHSASKKSAAFSSNVTQTGCSIISVRSEKLRRVPPLELGEQQLQHDTLRGDMTNISAPAIWFCQHCDESGDSCHSYGTNLLPASVDHCQSANDRNRRAEKYWLMTVCINNRIQAICSIHK